MLRPAMNDILKSGQSYYSFVLAIAKRARDIAQNFKDENVITDEKPVLLAIEDFKNHKYNILEPEDE